MARVTIAVIGGTGFIGRHLLERLAVETTDRLRVLIHNVAPDWLRGLPDVQVVHGDLLRPASLSTLLDGTSAVINLAGQVSADVDGYQGINLRGMVWLAQACVKHKVRRVIHASSALVYGNALDATEDNPCRPISPYAAMKLAAEEVLGSVLSAKAELLTLRLSDVYGPRQSKGLMPYLVKRILHHEPIMIDADGAQVRDFIHVQDVATAVVKTLAAPTVTGVLNIGSGQATSIMSLVRLLEEVLEYRLLANTAPEHSGGERRNTMNVERARNILELEHDDRSSPGNTDANDSKRGV